MAIASKEKSIIETETFKAYKNSEPNHLSKYLAKQAIITYLLGFANTKDENVRIKNLEELSENITYAEAVEFYTDFAKMEDKCGVEDIEPIMLELLRLLSNKK